MRATFIVNHYTAVYKVDVDYENNTNNDCGVVAMNTINRKFLAAGILAV